MADIRAILSENEITDYQIIDTDNVYVRQWVRVRCMFGCDNYGKFGSCPPAVPSIAECRETIQEYSKAVLFHKAVSFSDAQQYRQEMGEFEKKLKGIEREAFLAGYYKAFLLVTGNCVECKTCTADGCREKCINKKMSRPGMDAFGIDVYETARKAGYKIEVVKDYSMITDRFALLLLE